MFITFEAMDGAGKTTQVKLLAEHLRDAGVDVVLTREPGGSPLAEQLRSIVLEGEPGRMDAETEMLLFMAARRDHLTRVIRPALNRGAIVICDRYVGSTRALQGAAGVPRKLIDSVFSDFCGLEPDITYFLSMDAHTALDRSIQRLGASGSDEGRFEAKGVDFHTKVGQLFESQCAESSHWIRINAAQSIPEVHGDIVAHLRKALHVDEQVPLDA